MANNKSINNTTPRQSWTFDEYTNSEIRRAANTGIYDIRGGNIIKLFNQFVSSGRHLIYWDGKNDKGYNMPGGVYFYSIQSEKFRQTNKMILLK